MGAPMTTSSAAISASTARWKRQSPPSDDARSFGDSNSRLHRRKGYYAYRISALLSRRDRCRVRDFPYLAAREQHQLLTGQTSRIDGRRIQDTSDAESDLALSAPLPGDSHGSIWGPRPPIRTGSNSMSADSTGRHPDARMACGRSAVGSLQSNSCHIFPCAAHKAIHVPG